VKKRPRLRRLEIVILMITCICNTEQIKTKKKKDARRGKSIRVEKVGGRSSIHTHGSSLTLAKRKEK